MMKRLYRVGYSVVLVAGLAAPAATTPSFAADPAPKPDHGQTLVQRWCVACHLVGTDQKGASTDAPPFASIAKRPDFGAAKVAFFLLDPHPKMPNFPLSRNEAADLAAYIGSLRK